MELEELVLRWLHVDSFLLWLLVVTQFVRVQLTRSCVLIPPPPLPLPMQV